MEVILRWTVRIAGIGLSVFHIYTGLFGAIVSPELKAVHVLLVLLLVFLLIPMRKSKPGVRWWDIPLIIAVLAGSAYTFFNWERFLPIMVAPPGILEYVMALAMILAVLEAGRRSVGWVFPSLTTVSPAYALWGHYISGYWGHAPFSGFLVFANNTFQPFLFPALVKS
jgi:TRAP-type uncharacterized transport system fused permease subunit